MKKYFKIFMVCVGVSIFTGCSDFLDINEDPNNPTDIPVKQLLPAVEVRLAAALGQSGLGGTASVFMQHNVVRGNLNDYNITPANVVGSWNTLYIDCLTDIREIERIGGEAGYTNYTGVAKILKGYIFSVLVDLWGDVPFTQANLGSLEPTPSFDSGAEVYAAAMALIDEGIAETKVASPLSMTGTAGGDLIYNGDLAKWEKFGNTVKLKMYNQMRLVDDVSAEVNALLSQPLISSAADDFELPYGTSSAPDDRNPSYPGQYAPGSKTSPNPYFYEVMSNLNTFAHGGNIFPVVDPRTPYYWHRQLVAGGTAQNNIAYPIGAAGNKVTPSGFVSIFSFSFNIDPNEGFDQSESATVQGLYPIGGRYDDGSGAKANNNGWGRTPQRLLTYKDRVFIEAELVLTEPGVTSPNGTAAELTQDAIEASFAKVNEVATEAGAPLMSAATISNYVTAVMGVYNAEDAEGQLQVLITQKWISNYGSSLDSFTDFRRTGYPILHDGNTDNLNVTNRTRDYIVSFPYPDNEILLNPDAPAQRNPYLSKVFWDN